MKKQIFVGFIALAVLLCTPNARSGNGLVLPAYIPTPDPSAKVVHLAGSYSGVVAEPDGTTAAQPNENIPPGVHQYSFESTAGVAPSPPPGFEYVGTGPYFGNYSKPGYSGVRGYVYLPCKAASLKMSGKDALETGYVYVGGFGAGNNSTAVDAGFQESSIHDGSEADNYALVVKYQNKSGMDHWTNRFSCDQEVYYSFETISPTLLVINATGEAWFKHNKKYATGQVPIHPNPGDGWDPSGRVPGITDDAVVVKRMVSIAQPPEWSSFINGNRNWFRNGSYFGHRAGNRTPLVHWRGCEVKVSIAGVFGWVTCDNVMIHNHWSPHGKGAYIHPDMAGAPPDDFSVAIDLH